VVVFLIIQLIARKVIFWSQNKILLGY